MHKHSIIIFVFVYTFFSSLLAEEFVFTGSNRGISLPDSFLISYSETLLCDGQLLERGVQYQIDYLTGKIELLEIPVCDTLKVKYRKFLFRLPLKLRHRIPQMGEGGVQVAREVESEGVLETSHFDHTGSILRGIKVGTNRDLSIKSGFDLEASGSIGKDVKIAAVLSDENSPIQPEGTSEELEEIDKLYIQASSPHFNATFGDFSVDFSSTEFARYNRRLQGVKGEATFKEFEVNLAGASSRGEFTSFSFYGSESNQGPYQLYNEKGNKDLIILAGTEKVWLDGELMKRGEDNHYTIDYNAAQITFMPSQQITSNSRIVVDFEYSTQNYNRTFLQGEAVINPTHNLSITSTFLTQRDDKNNPIELDLSQEEKAILDNAGDIADSAYVSGIDSVGEGNGDYDLADSAGVNYLVYTGEDSGTYDASFTYVGSGQGDYSYLGNGIYEWVGENSGSYLPLEYLPLPSKKDIYDFRMDYRPGGNFEISGEFASSNHDVNTFSNLDDNDNVGNAYNIQAAFNTDELNLLSRNIGKVEVSGKFRNIGARFSPLGRITDADYNRNWNITRGEKENEIVRELSVGYNPVTLVVLDGSYARLTRGDILSIRQGGALSINRNEYLYGKLSISNTRSWQDGFEGYLKIYRGEVIKPNKTIEPYFNYEREDKKLEYSPSEYYLLNKYIWGFSLNLLSNWKQNYSFTYSHEKRFLEDIVMPIEGLPDYAEVSSFEYNTDILKNISVMYRYRNYQVLPYFIKDRQISNTLKTEGRYYTRNRLFGFNLYYQFSNKQTAEMERIYTQVEEGEGNYIYDVELDQYIPDSDGDFILEKRSTGKFTPVIETEFNLRTSLNPGNLKKAEGWLYSFIREISSELTLSGERISLYNNDIKNYYIHPDNFLGDTAVQYANFEVEERLYLFRRRRLSLDYRFKWFRSLNRRYLTGEENNFELLHSGVSRYSFPNIGGLSLTFENKNQVAERGYSYYTDLDLVANSAILFLYYNGIEQLYSSVDIKLSAENNRQADTTKVIMIEFGSEARYNLWQGLLRGSFRYSRVDATPEEVILPYEMAEGDKPGVNLDWMLGYDWQFSRYTTARIKYRGEKDPDIETLHYFEAEVRLEF